MRPFFDKQSESKLAADVARSFERFMGKVSKGFTERFHRERMLEFIAKGKWTPFSEGWPDMKVPHYVRLTDGRVFLAQYYRPASGGWCPDEINRGTVLDWTPSYETWNAPKTGIDMPS